MFSRVVLGLGESCGRQSVVFSAATQPYLLHNQRRNKCIRKAAHECASVSEQVNGVHHLVLSQSL